MGKARNKGSTWSKQMLEEGALGGILPTVWMDGYLETLCPAVQRCEVVYEKAWTISSAGKEIVFASDHKHIAGEIGRVSGYAKSKL